MAFEAVLTTLVIIILGLIITYYYFKHKRLRPHLPPRVDVGQNFLQMLKAFQTDPAPLLQQCADKYGDVFYIQFYFTTFCFVLGPEGSRFIVDSKSSELSVLGALKTFLKGVLPAESLRDRTHEELAERGEKVAISIRRNRDEFLYFVVQETITHFDQILQKDPNNTFDLLEEIDQLVTNINIKCFLGSEAREQHRNKIKSLLRDNEKIGFSLLGMFANWLPFGPGQQCVKIRKELENILVKIIDDRQKKNPGKSDYPDVLNYYVTATKKNGQTFTSAELNERMLTLFFAASVNTLKTASWFILNTFCRKSVSESLREILDPVLLENIGNGPEPAKPNDVPLSSWNSIMADKTIDYTMKESVRPVYGSIYLNRSAKQDLNYKGYVIPKNWMVSTSAQVLGSSKEGDTQKELKGFMDDWKEWNPDRWEKVSEDPKLMKWLFMFFGGGLHVCKGQVLAMLAVKLSLAVMVTRYDLKWLGQKNEGEVPAPGPGVMGQIPSPKDPALCRISWRRVNNAAGN